MKHLKVLFLFFSIFLFGFSTADQEEFIVKFKNSNAIPEVVFSKIEDFTISQGFVLVKKIAESIPEDKVVSEFRMGAPFQGGVLLALTIKK